MTLKEKILFLTSQGYTQQKIGEETGISQSSISRILMGAQQSVQYEKGEALNALYQKLGNPPLLQGHSTQVAS
ncbi:helix-turn-helix domain-containing protein [Acinetobacter cumulans]|uniref:Helix-turn-helix domain-containing protein n=1 Tax=Acinetobacter cumulans TaxID=2136182 RepID=A0A3A8FK38_9GAMM|nr:MULTISPECIES: helix-turn-helix domain-containing protein [Acinetobacter]RKG47335.1 helix-turn-helix domain-containing protein [Acinetobacter cumulans]WOE40731.1 helix-turn-helix domain-containing protein [Acinetobacter chinensis]